MEAGKYFKKKQKIFFWEREVNKFGHKFRFRTQDLEKAQVLIQVWYKPQQQTIKDAKKVAEYWEKLMGKGTATVQINTCPSG